MLRTQGRHVRRLPAGLIGAGLVYFFDGTWVEEDDAATAHYPDANNNTHHGEPGLNQNDGAGDARQVYLRLPRTVRLPAGRDITFVFFFTSIISWSIEKPNQIDVLLGLVTAAFSQATLEAMTWNNKLAAPGFHQVVGTLWQDQDGTDAIDIYWKNTPNARGSALAVRFAPAAATDLTGVMLEIPDLPPNPSTFGSGRIKTTRSGKPQRSFLVLE